MCVICDIIVSVFSLCRPAKDGPKHPARKDYAISAGVSFLSSRVERTASYVSAGLSDRSWSIGNEAKERCIVKIELPAGVYFGDYKIGNVCVHGLHGDYSARDGMGKAVFAYCKKSPLCETGHGEDALREAISSGIMLSVPQKDGTRMDIQARVLDISKVYQEIALDGWIWIN